MLKNTNKKISKQDLKNIDGIAFDDEIDQHVNLEDHPKATGLYSSKVIGQY